jgi:amidase
MELHYRSLIDIARDIKTRRLSPVDVTDILLARIDRLDPSLRSFTTITVDLAREQARVAEQEIDAGNYRGVLHGIPIAVKDLCFTRGVTTTGGMAIYRDFIPDFDATVIRRLQDAGAIMLGKLHMTEGASFSHHPEMPPPVNPWDKGLWPGVSSSGSGVATAAGLCFASLGSDTGASVRFPSACNGLTGVKPTWGRVSRHGVFAFAETFDVVGPIARSAADAAALLGAISGYDPLDPTTLSDPVPDFLGDLAGVAGVRGLRVGIDRQLLSSASVELGTAICEVAERLSDLGGALVEISYPSTSDLEPWLPVLAGNEMALAHEQTFPSKAERYGGWITDHLNLGRGVSALDLARGRLERVKFKGRVERLFTEVDLVLLPVMPFATPTWDEINALGHELRNLIQFTMPINAAGVPAVAIPCGFNRDGRPMGLQLVGGHGSEAKLLRVAHAYQQVTDWHLRRPQIAAG